MNGKRQVAEQPRDRSVPAGRSSARIATVAILLAVLASVVFLPGGLNRWVLPKDAVMASAALLATFVVPAGRLPRWLLAVLAAAGLLLVVAALSSSEPAAQLLGRFPRYEGLVSLPVYAAALWAGARLFGPGSDPGRRKALTQAAALAAVLLGSVASLEATGLRPIPSDLTRPGSLTGNATDQGVLALLLLAIVLLPVVRYVFPDPQAPGKKRRRPKTIDVEFPWLAALGLVFAVIAVVTSSSRTVLAGAVVILVVVSAAEALRARRQGTRMLSRVLTALGALIVLVGSAIAVPLTRTRLLSESQAIEDRTTIWRQAVKVLLQHPFLGVGPSGFVDSVPRVEGADWYPSSGSAPVLDSPHNWILQAVVAGGPILALAAVATATVVLVIGYRRWSLSLRSRGYATADSSLSFTAGLAAFAVVLLTGFTAPSTAIPAAMFAGALVAVPSAVKAPPPVAWVALRTLAVGAWVVALFVGTFSEIPLAEATTAAAANDVASAEADFDVAIALRPWDPDAEGIAAQTFARMADAGVASAAEPAVQHARAALARTPHSVTAQVALIVGLQNSGDDHEALVAATSLARHVPHDPDVQLRLANAQWAAGERSVSIATLRRVTAMIPDDPRPWAALEAAYRSEGNIGAADEAADEASRRSG